MKRSLAHCLLLATCVYGFVNSPLAIDRCKRTTACAATRLPVKETPISSISTSTSTKDTPPIYPPALPDLKSPVGLYDNAVVMGTYKASSPALKIFKLGLVAGCQVAFGAYQAISVGGACPGLAESNPGLQKLVMGAFGLPLGLILSLVTGAELFTGNTALVMAAYMEKKIKRRDLLKNWFSSYVGNFVGALFLAYLAFKSGTLGSAPGAAAIATAKMSLPWEAAFVRGILCNWLVCSAVYMAAGCSSMIGKIAAIWFPVSAFASIGLDHSVANMFILPLGIMRGAKFTVGEMFWNNLIPVTLGNIVGGALCVMAPFGTTLGKWFKQDDA